MRQPLKRALENYSKVRKSCEFSSFEKKLEASLTENLRLREENMLLMNKLS